MKKKKFLRPNNPWIVIPVFSVLFIELAKSFFGLHIPYLTPVAIAIGGVLIVLDAVGHIFGIDITKDEDELDNK